MRRDDHVDELDPAPAAFTFASAAARRGFARDSPRIAAGFISAMLADITPPPLVPAASVVTPTLLPVVPLAVERPAAIVVVPVIAKREGDRGQAELRPVSDDRGRAVLVRR